MLDQLITGVLIIHFTVGFFLALALLMMWFNKEFRDYVLENADNPQNIRIFLENPIFMFVTAILAGFPALVVIVISEMKSIRNK